MQQEDATLQHCNESELISLARRQGLPVLRRGLPRDLLIALVSGSEFVREEHLSGTNYTRGRLQDFVQDNINRLRGQLPGCNGMCRTFDCTEGKHMSCFVPSEPLLL